MFTQKNHPLQVQTSLGKDTFLLESVAGEQGVNQDFQFTLHLLSAQNDLAIDSLVGKTVSFSCGDDPNNTQPYHGVVAMVYEDSFQVASFCRYVIELRPWFYFLRETRHSRIFQNKSVVDIIKSVLADADNQALDVSKLSGNYPPLTYSTQFDESDYDFVSRLLQQYGLFYYYRFQMGKHVLTLGDSVGAYHENSAFTLTRLPDQHVIGQLSVWQRRAAFQPKAAFVAGHDWQQPSSLQQNGEAGVRHFYQAQGTEQLEAQQKALSAEVQKSSFYGESDYIQLTAGDKLTLDDALGGSSVVITRISWQAKDPSYFLTTAGFECTNQFEAVPATVVCRPWQVIRKPSFTGLQQAIVSGPSDAEVYCDEQGRVKVYFYWDENGKPDETSSCWIRVMYEWSGILRVGTPVLVSFVDGDIDRPVIVGQVNNAKQAPLYALKDQQYVSGFKRRGGGHEAMYNELTLNDQKDKQLLSVLAAKDMLVDVKNERTVTIKKDDSLTIEDGNLIIDVKSGTCTINVKGDVKLSSSGNLSLEAERNLTLKGDKIAVEASGELSLKGANIKETASASLEMNAGMGKLESSGVLTLKGSLLREN